jgi:hypothetical protein
MYYVLAPTGKSSRDVFHAEDAARYYGARAETELQ